MISVCTPRVVRSDSKQVGKLKQLQMVHQCVSCLCTKSMANGMCISCANSERHTRLLYRLVQLYVREVSVAKVLVKIKSFVYSESSSTHPYSARVIRVQSNVHHSDIICLWPSVSCRQEGPIGRNHVLSLATGACTDTQTYSKRPSIGLGQACGQDQLISAL